MAGRTDFIPITERLLERAEPEIRSATLRALAWVAPTAKLYDRFQHEESPGVRTTALVGLVFLRRHLPVGKGSGIDRDTCRIRLPGRKTGSGAGHPLQPRGNLPRHLADPVGGARLGDPENRCAGHGRDQTSGIHRQALADAAGACASRAGASNPGCRRRPGPGESRAGPFRSCRGFSDSSSCTAHRCRVCTRGGCKDPPAQPRL